MAYAVVNRITAFKVIAFRMSVETENTLDIKLGDDELQEVSFQSNRRIPNLACQQDDIPGERSRYLW